MTPTTIEISILLPDANDKPTARKIHAERSASPHMAIHRDVFLDTFGPNGGVPLEDHGYTITHIPTGLAITRRLAHKIDAERCVNALLAIKEIDWSKSDWDYLKEYRVRVLDRIDLYEKLPAEENQ